MRISIYLLAPIIFAIANIRSMAQVRTFEATVTDIMQLEGVLGDEWDKIDSLVVHGPISVEDFDTMYKCCFYGDLTAINIEDTDVEYKMIPDYAFVNVRKQYYEPSPYMLQLKLHTVILPDDIEEIGKLAFSLTKIKQIKLPSALRNIGESAFAYCFNLTDISIPEGVESISESCFYDCDQLNTVSLPSTIKTIDYAAFYMAGISDINFPEGLETISDVAFFDTKLKNAILPNSVTSLGVAAFSWIKYLKKVKLPERLTSIPNLCFAYSDSISSLEIPETVEEIGDMAFALCYDLEPKLPNRLKRIGEDAFEYCAYDTLVFPATLEAIGVEAFYYNRNLKVIYCLSPEPPALESNTVNPDHGIFGPNASCMPKDIPIYVPIGSAAAYRIASGWDYYTNYIETDNFPSNLSLPQKMSKSPGFFFDLFGRQQNELCPGFNIIQKDGVTKKVMIRE